MPNEKKIYVGSGKVSKNPKYIKANLSEKGLREMLDNLDEYNGNKYAKIDIVILEEPNKYGKTVEITRDTWKREGSEPQQSKVSEPTANNEVRTEEDIILPF